GSGDTPVPPACRQLPAEVRVVRAYVNQGMRFGGHPRTPGLSAFTSGGWLGEGLCQPGDEVRGTPPYPRPVALWRTWGAPPA
ncbi:MAG: hypothetical protein Q8O86_11520, partial [Dehalococcoidia bacterium]|nr:hypothetical protein [Dehalococcoidia bacterium]